MATKEMFLRHVHERLARIPHTTKTEALEDISKVRNDFSVTYVEIDDSNEGMIKKFSNELTLLNGIVKTTSSAEETFTAIQNLLADRGSKKIIAWNDGSLDTYGLDRLREQGFELMTSPEDRTEYKHFAKDADTGITTATFAVAETGSIIVESGVGRERSVSLMPNLHIAIVKSNQFVKRTADVFRYLVDRKHQLPSSVNFITGPSRSADIEMDLSIGVHGPASICVIIETTS